MSSLLCKIFGHWWYWWTDKIREKPEDMLPGFVYSCRRCPMEMRFVDKEWKIVPATLISVEAK